MNKYLDALDTITDWFSEHYENFNGKKTLVREKHITEKYDDAVNTLRGLVEKQEPHKIRKETRGCFPNYDKNGTYHTTYKCPCCNAIIHLDWHERRNYCPECGCKIELPNDEVK